MSEPEVIDGQVYRTTADVPTTRIDYLSGPAGDLSGPGPVLSVGSFFQVWRAGGGGGVAITLGTDSTESDWTAGAGDGLQISRHDLEVNCEPVL